jgi:hypothetical protein
MANIHRPSRSVSTMVAFLNLAGTQARPVLAYITTTAFLTTLAFATTFAFSVTCLAQDQNNNQNQDQNQIQDQNKDQSQSAEKSAAQPDAQSNQAQSSQVQSNKIQSNKAQSTQTQSNQSQEQASNIKLAVTIPVGTHIALVLTHPIQSRYVHRGDDIYAQVTAPVNSGDEVVVPPGTFVQGTVDKLDRNGGRAELHLTAMSITFPDGYIAPIAGPITLESGDGYAIKDPGRGRITAAFALPVAGIGMGALIGHAAAGNSTQTITSSIPSGCTGPPPLCVSSSLTVPASTGKSTAIGAMVGGAIGGVASFALLFSSHNFFIDVGSPVDMTLRQPVTLQQDEVAKAVQEAAKHPVAAQPIWPRPWPPVVDYGPAPGPTPGPPPQPPLVIPGPPGANGVPGPPIVIPQ